MSIGYIISAPGHLFNCPEVEKIGEVRVNKQVERQGCGAREKC
jgi:hypothetical protein